MHCETALPRAAALASGADGVGARGGARLAGAAEGFDLARQEAEDALFSACDARRAASLPRPLPHPLAETQRAA